jgi:dihydropteroate synthase
MNACQPRWLAPVWRLNPGVQIIRAHDVAETIQAVRE